MNRLTLHHLLYLIIIALPLWGFSLLNVGTRGIRVDWVLIAAAGVLLFVKLCLQEKHLVKDSFLFYIIVFDLCILMSAITPITHGRSDMLIDFFTTFLQIQLCFILFVLGVSIKMSHHQIRRLIYFYIGISGIIAAFGILQFIGARLGYNLQLTFTNVGTVDPSSGYQGLFGSYGRATSMFSEPRQFGNYLVVRFCILLAAILLNLQIFKRRYSSYFVLTILGAGILCSLSISAFFILAFSVVLLTLKLAKRGVSFKIFGISVMFLLPVLVMVSFLGSDSTVVSGLFTRLSFLRELPLLYEQFIQMSHKNYGALGYVGGWRFALDILLEHPITGVGLNNLIYYEKYGLHGVHGFLKFIAQTGLVGTLGGFLLFAGFFSMYKKLRKTLSISRGDLRFASMSALFVIIPLIVSFGSGLYSFSSTFFWFDVSIGAMILCSLKRNVLLGNFPNNRLYIRKVAKNGISELYEVRT